MCWFVYGNVPSVLNNVIESAKQKKFATCNLVLKSILEFLKSNQMQWKCSAVTGKLRW